MIRFFDRGKHLMGCYVLDELMKKKELVQWNKDTRKERFLLVSRSGFTKKCIDRQMKRE